MTVESLFDEEGRWITQMDPRPRPLVEHPAFDLSKAQPGDVVVISDVDLYKLSAKQASEIGQEVQRLAEARGIRLTQTRDENKQEYRILVE